MFTISLTKRSTLSDKIYFTLRVLKILQEAAEMFLVSKSECEQFIAQVTVQGLRLYTSDSAAGILQTVSDSDSKRHAASVGACQDNYA